jgi:hypothetical protein
VTRRLAMISTQIQICTLDVTKLGIVWNHKIPLRNQHGALPVENVGVFKMVNGPIKILSLNFA